MGKVLRKVTDCQTQLKLWDKNTFGNICIKLDRKRKQLLKAKGILWLGVGMLESKCSLMRHKS